jgi:hypothetical protein
MHVRRNNPGYEYQMNGTRLTTTDEEKRVAVWITKNLKPTEHNVKRLLLEQRLNLINLQKNFITEIAIPI